MIVAWGSSKEIDWDSESFLGRLWNSESSKGRFWAFELPSPSSLEEAKPRSWIQVQDKRVSAKLSVNVYRIFDIEST